MPNGGFTLPTEVGYEDLTLALAEKWGADVVRDSNGTALPESILRSGMGVYSTLCLIREDNAWAKAHQHWLQQNFLMSEPVAATGAETEVELLTGYSTDQFRVNEVDGLEFWQVFDRTSGAELPSASWSLLPGGVVRIAGTETGHVYTVNFLAVRIWEEISMYNHVTNDWGDAEHLMAVEPRYPEVAEHLLEWLDRWCAENPATTVVRFTSLFYNFAWFWGSDPQRLHVYSDWASYDFTVTPLALRQFTEQTGLAITSEDFVNAGRYCSTHNPPSAVYRAWIEFVAGFVRELGRRCVDVVHSHGKQAYVFYDDSWIGLEPYSGHFEEFGFDGIIKAVFSAYEARLCAGVPVGTHELRLHPYLFPVDLEGKPTFTEGAEPTPDLWRYWRRVRRGMLRAKIDRIGLGGYLSLTAPFPGFQDAVAEIADQHRLIRSLHEQGTPAVEPIRIGILTSWGSLRTWSTSGHLHEHPALTLTHTLEALAGLPYQVDFLALADVESSGVPAGIDVLINAGPGGSAWSGGAAWGSPGLAARLRDWVRDGGGLIGIEEPTATVHGLGYFQLSDVLGVDRDQGDRACLARRRWDLAADHPLVGRGATAPQAPVPGVFVTRPGVEVAASTAGIPTATATRFGQGRAVYLAGVDEGAGQARLLENAVLIASGREPNLPWSQNPAIDITYFPGSGIILASNSTSQAATTTIHNAPGLHEISLNAGELGLRKLPRQT